MDTIRGLKRTCLCAELGLPDSGKNVTLMGWAQKVRDMGQIIFVDLRDRSGIIQLVFENDAALLEKAKQIRQEYVLAITGKVRQRGQGSVNLKLKTGEIEVQVEELRILSRSEPLPVQIEEDSTVKEDLRLKYRYLDLRRPDLQQNLILRHRVAKLARDFFDDNGFLEIETPMLIKSTPEGARDYIVPSRVHPGKFYALPQSPQLYKQILMISGFDRYFQIAKCFRDEDLRSDRQPEFTQIDLEMSFVDVDDVIEVNERFLKKVFKEILDIDLQLPLPRMTYAEAISRFGSDKPDTRFGMELANISDIVKNCGFKVFADNVRGGGSVRAINARGLADKLSRRELDGLTEFVKIFKAKGMAWIVLSKGEMRSQITKFLTQEETGAILSRTGAQEGDAVLIVSDRDEVVLDALGNLRLELARRYGLIDKSKYSLLWVTEFPLLEYDLDQGRYVAKHHPFTSPMDEDIPLLDTDPGKVRAKAYDIVLNGVEIGGGSIRIHDTAFQQRMFDYLGFSREEAWERFGFLLEAFKYGTPPHGGMAYGLDRLVMLLAGCETIRDVIAFPKVQSAAELMSGAPSYVEKKQLDELKIKFSAVEAE